MMFSIDWPFESNKVGIDYLKHLPLSPADLAKVAGENAATLLRIGLQNLAEQADRRGPVREHAVVRGPLGQAPPPQVGG